MKPVNLYLNWAIILSIGMGVVSRLGWTDHGADHSGGHRSDAIVSGDSGGPFIYINGKARPVTEFLEIDDIEKRTTVEVQIQQRKTQDVIALQHLKEQYREALDALIVSESQVLNELHKEIERLGENAPVELKKEAQELEKRIEELNEQSAREKENALPDSVLIENPKAQARNFRSLYGGQLPSLRRSPKP